MQSLDYIFLIVFITIILVTGLFFAKVGGKSMKSFFAAGGAVPWQINGLSLFMGFFSAGTFVVWGSIAYTLGWVSISIQWTMAIAGFVVGLLIASKWRKTNTLTAASYITNRLGEKVQKTYTILFLLISLFTTGSFLYPVARIVEVSTGLPLNTSILILGAICILYVSIGGLWAVVITDVLQFIILTAAVIIVVPLAFGRLGDVSSFITEAPQTFFKLTNGEYTLGFIIAFGVYNAIFLGGNWAYVQRYSSVKTPKDAKKVGYLFGTLYLFSPILWMLPPMIYKIINPSLSGLGDEGAYLLMCKEVLPAGLLGMMLGGMIFATASSLNATLNISSGVFTNDIFTKLRPKAKPESLIKVARISTIVFGVLAIIVALLVPLMGGIVNVVISVAALTGVPLYLPVIWTLFSKRQTGKSILTTTILSLIVNVFFKFITPMYWGLSLSRANEMILGVVFPIVCLSLFELYYIFKKQQAHVPVTASFTNTAEESVSDNETSDQSNNKYSLRVLSFGILLTGAIISALGIIADTGKIIVISVGIILLFLGFILNRKSFK